jgi:hypothetical protein
MKQQMLNYKKLMSYNPTSFGTMTNSMGQLIEFIEHPTLGDEYPVIAVCHKLGKAGVTDFYDLDDMMANHGEYEPWFNSQGELFIGN